MKLHLILLTIISIGLCGNSYAGNNTQSNSSQAYPTAPSNPQTYPVAPSNPQTYPTSPSSSQNNNTQQGSSTTNDNNEKGLPALDLKNPFGVQPIDFFGDSTSGASSWNVVDTTNSVTPSGDPVMQPSADAFGFSDEDIGTQSESYGD